MSKDSLLHLLGDTYVYKQDILKNKQLRKKMRTFLRTLHNQPPRIDFDVPFSPKETNFDLVGQNAKFYSKEGVIEGDVLGERKNVFVVRDGKKTKIVGKRGRVVVIGEWYVLGECCDIKRFLK